MCENPEKPTVKNDDHYTKLVTYWHEYVQQLKEESGHQTPLDQYGLEELIPILMREHPTYDWRSPEAITRELGVELSLVQAAINSLMAKGVVVQSTRNENHYGLLERVKKTYPEAMWNQKGQFDIGINSCPPPCPAPVNPHLVKPVVTFYKAKVDMFEPLQECLREVQKLISTAEKLNQEVLTFQKT